MSFRYKRAIGDLLAPSDYYSESESKSTSMAYAFSTPTMDGPDYLFPQTKLSSGPSVGLNTTQVTSRGQDALKQLALAARAKLDKHQRNTLDQHLQATPPPDIATITSLLSQGADPNLHPKGKSTSPLYSAASAGEIPTLTLLLDAGALIDAQGGPYNTALKGAILANQQDSAVSLLERGANVNHRDGFADMTPLGLAARDRHLELVATLLEYGADANLHCAPLTSPVALIQNGMCTHKTQKTSCKKCPFAGEYRQILAMLEAYGGTNSAKEMGTKAAKWLAETWKDAEKTYASDSDVRRAMKRLEKAKKRKKEREERARYRAEEDYRRCQAGAAYMRMQN